jgi:hypothetical protein
LINKAAKATRFLGDLDGLHGSDHDVVDQTQKTVTYPVVRKSGSSSVRGRTRDPAPRVDEPGGGDETTEANKKAVPGEGNGLKVGCGARI